MGRKNRNKINTREILDEHNHEHHKPHHRAHDTFHGEVCSSGEELESSGELESNIDNVPPYVSTTGRLLTDYPVEHAHETPEQREDRRIETAVKQLDSIDTSSDKHEEDVQIDRYRAMHRATDQFGKPHTMIDDELLHAASDVYNEKTSAGDPIVRKNAHGIVGAQQSYQARHLAIKRQLGLSEEDKTISPASPHKKQ